MNILQLTPGAGAMYCGNCLRDNALVAALRARGHEVCMVPLYLPLTLDEPDQSAATPIFFGGISVYLQQQSAVFRSAPGWFHNLLASRPLLNWAAGKAAKTRAADVGDLTLSMLRGESGNQARELDGLLAWLQRQPKPDAVCLSNGLLIGLARRLKRELGAPIICGLQGEDSFLDLLPENVRNQCWHTLAERAAEAEALAAPSRYFAERMQQRLGLPPSRIRVIPNGINLEGYPTTPREAPDASPAIGFFTRMCPEKGLDTLVDAWLLLRRGGRIPGLKLRVGGSCGPADEPFVNELRQKIQQAGLSQDATFHPNVDRPAKLRLLRSLTVFSVPARYGEAFGLYLLEAMAAGVPVVQPDTAAFPELIAGTGGGLLCRPGDVEGLAEAIEQLLLDPARARALGEAGQRAVFANYTADSMADRMLELIRQVGAKPAQPFH